MPPSSRVNVETTYPSHGMLKRGAHVSPKWVGRIFGSIEEIATLIVRIKRPAVAPISEQPNTTDFRLPLLCSCRVMIFPAGRMCYSRIASMCTLCRYNVTHLTGDGSKTVPKMSVYIRRYGATHNLSSSISQLFSPYIYCSTISLCPWRNGFVDLSGTVISFSTLAKYWPSVH
jgi:hypothetical protein